MTTLDGVERTFDAQSVLVCDRDGPSGIAGIMGGQVSEVSDSTTRILLEVATWNGVNILRTSRRWPCAPTPPPGSRSSSIRSLPSAPSASPRSSWSSYAERSCFPDHRRGGGAAPPRRSRCAPRPAEALLGMHIEPDAWSPTWSGWGSRSSAPDDDLVAEVPAHRYYDVEPRGGPDRGGRPHPRLDEHLPSTLPAGGGAGWAPEPRAGPRRRAEDVMRDLGFDAIVASAWPIPAAPRLRLPGTTCAARRSASPTRSRSTTPSCARPCSAPSSTLPATTSHGAPSGWRCPSPAASICPRRVARGRRPRRRLRRRRPPPAFEPQRIGALSVGPLAPPSWRDEPRAGRLLRDEGRARGARAAQLGADVALEAGAAAVPSPRPLGEGDHRRDPRRLAGRAAPARLPRVGPESAGRPSSSTSPDLCRVAAGREAYEDVTTYPAVLQDLAVVVDEDVLARGVRSAVLRCGWRAAAERRGVRPLPR